jgi:hypothetical protein
MGGWGSGSWYRWNKKNTVDDGLSLDINKLVRDGLIIRDYAVGSLKWTNTRTGTETASVGFSLEPFENNLIMRLHYIRTARNGDKDNFNYPIELQTTQPNFGGRRWWFTCPLMVNGRLCGRRVGKLYLPPAGKYFGCRHCYDLTYQSCQESDKRLTFFWKNPAALKAAIERDHLSPASFLAFRAYFKFMNRYEEENKMRHGKRRGRPPSST